MSLTRLRNSERSAFKTCRFRWALTYGGVFEVGPLRSKEPAKALWFGDLIHQGLAGYYKKGLKRGPAPAKTFIRLYDTDPRLSAVLKNDEGEWESMRDLGRGMLEAYVVEYADRDDEWEVLSSEGTFQLPIEVPEFVFESVTVPGFALHVVGTFDGVWRHRVEKDRVAFAEHKTAATISLDGLAMDEQASFYWTYGPRWLWKKGVLPKKAYPSEILYNFLRKAIRNPDDTWSPSGHRLNNPTKPDLLAAFPKLVTEKMKLEDMIAKIGPAKAAQAGQPSKSQPSAFFERQPVYRDLADRTSTHDRVLAEAREMQLARAGILTAYKNPGPLHMPNCRGCPVRDPCELHETGNDFMSMLNATTESWDPYEAHEIVERR